MHQLWICSSRKQAVNGHANRMIALRSGCTTRPPGNLQGLNTHLYICKSKSELRSISSIRPSCTRSFIPNPARSHVAASAGSDPAIGPLEPHARAKSSEQPRVSMDVCDRISLI